MSKPRKRAAKSILKVLGLNPKNQQNIATIGIELLAYDEDKRLQLQDLVATLESREITLQEAGDRLAYLIREDEDIFRAYQANIASAFQEEFKRYLNTSASHLINEQALSPERINSVANHAAINFLHLFTGSMDHIRNPMIIEGANPKAADTIILQAFHFLSGLGNRFRYDHVCSLSTTDINELSLQLSQIEDYIKTHIKNDTLFIKSDKSNGEYIKGVCIEPSAKTNDKEQKESEKEHQTKTNTYAHVETPPGDSILDYLDTVAKELYNYDSWDTMSAKVSPKALNEAYWLSVRAYANNKLPKERTLFIMPTYKQNDEAAYHFDKGLSSAGIVHGTSLAYQCDNGLRIFVYKSHVWHISVSHPDRVPTFEELFWIRGEFATPIDERMQMAIVLEPSSKYFNDNTITLFELIYS